MWAQRKKSLINGFTIVELLIVIVVIGILAAIVIVGFNGVQRRAVNTSTENTAQTYRRALMAYATQFGKYPTPTSACLAPTNNYDSAPSADDPDCAHASTSAQMETELKKVIASLPSVDTTCYTMYTGCRRNMTYLRSSTWTVDGATHVHYMSYYLGGNGNCTLADNLNGSYGSFSSNVTRPYMERSAGTTMCILKLPNPEEL